MAPAFLKVAPSLALLLVCLAATTAHGLSFTLESGTHRCFTDETHFGGRMFVKYRIDAGYGQSVDVVVTNHDDNSIVEKRPKTDQGEFRFETPRGGEYSLCFYSRAASGMTSSNSAAVLHRKVHFVFAVDGTSASIDYDAVARREKLKPFELKTKKIATAVHAIHADYSHFKKMEGLLSDTIASSYAKGVNWTAVSLLLLVFSTWWQYRSIKTILRKKKVL